MPDQLTNYQCPACTAPLHFSAKTGKLVCDYCGSVYEVAEIEKLYAAKEEKAAQAFTDAQKKAEAAKAEAAKAEVAQEETAQAGTAQAETEGGWDVSGMSEWGADTQGMHTYTCPSCGAELICDASTAATSCPYCGNPTVVPGQFTGGLKPDYVIPFKYEKNQAIEALKNHYKGKFLLPDAFKDSNHIEKIQGVYVPFWLFNAKADADVTFSAERSDVYDSGDEEVINTHHYQIRRAGSVSFENIPVDASTKMPDDYMDSIDPYEYKDLKPFSTAYLPGYLADRYDVSVAECEQRADERCKNSALQAMESTVTGYDTVTCTGGDVNVIPGEVHYALMPVWVLNTKWNGQDYLFTMNGQTGKFVGDLPADKKKVVLVFFIALLVAFIPIGYYFLVA